MANAEVPHISNEIALMKKAVEKEKEEVALHHHTGQEDIRFSTLIHSKTFQRNRKKFGWRTST